MGFNNVIMTTRNIFNLAQLWGKLMPPDHYLQSSFVNYDQNYIKPVTNFYLHLMKSF